MRVLPLAPQRRRLPALAFVAAAALAALVACSPADDRPTTSDVVQSDVPASVGDEESGAMIGMTATHNDVRDTVGVPPLVWSAQVAAFADAWAAELQSRGCALEHRPRSGEYAQQYGENIYWSWGMSPSPADVVDAWASEVSDYDDASNTCSNICGHYTQIVWAASQRLGCAMRSCDDGSQVWVCNYDPPGNWRGEKPY